LWLNNNYPEKYTRFEVKNMDVQSIVLFALIIFALFWLIMRLRGNVRNPSKLQTAMDLISAVNEDLKVINLKQTSPEDLKKFRISNWKLYQHHLDFLDKEYIEAITVSFNSMSDYNQKLIELKISPDNPRPQIDLDSLKTNVVKGRAGLAKWTQENVHREATKGFFSFRN
jgi:hypothetical protein